MVREIVGSLLGKVLEAYGSQAVFSTPWRSVLPFPPFHCREVWVEPRGWRYTGSGAHSWPDAEHKAKVIPSQSG